jgi:hypothetical protein
MRIFSRNHRLKNYLSPSMLLPLASFPKKTRTAMITATLPAMADTGREKLPPQALSPAGLER